MRNSFNQTAAAKTATPHPFAGLGFAMDGVREAARGMAPVRHRQSGDAGPSLPFPALVAQPSGYSLLVTLCREIRGR
ncbi:MAG: hypothetical protein KUA35_00975 [Pseudodesulfovibrio sp.]|uniref:Uncharacterized protein n=1 Tax=Pseudodesulfovibrio aespoeensis (strain ATCC 700646 / DSM 10631 / Aspo-2) TaxID=643562 RepID=E6VV38_PSEA9|nr:MULTISPECIES: hypothetical protein [Pseudodesulfovibrio]MBU4191138.1 hypothetical protein [Pseudomonadota bacterium]ADU61189.1 hypothetical protein Daes_0162 [Pseudodesulfovibrio aespoeensis Aspo-2]MBU4379397.1 hypothetical protein [Pseudomonadota bacterium]MBU4476640.1 hypothetical protein [Pseudomonadota bacterium]MBU4514812.1 hypothetical protein [Pseudomonadota bacterium]